MPIKCNKDNAWLGEAWYFWYNEQDALSWGNASKRHTGYFEVYKAEIDCKNILDTVFNEEYYLFWLKQIEKLKTLMLKAGENPTLKAMNEYFKSKGIWTKFDGVMFQDISANASYFVIPGFQYQKRIQLAVYNYSIISNFNFSYEGQCTK